MIEDNAIESLSKEMESRSEEMGFPTDAMTHAGDAMSFPVAEMIEWAKK